MQLLAIHVTAEFAKEEKKSFFYAPFPQPCQDWSYIEKNGKAERSAG